MAVAALKSLAEVPLIIERRGVIIIVLANILDPAHFCNILLVRTEAVLVIADGGMVDVM